jgi:hypothetical protein
MKRVPTGEIIPYHPAYGHARPEQIKLLRTLGAGPDFDQIPKDIVQQTNDKGIVTK